MINPARQKINETIRRLRCDCRVSAPFTIVMGTSAMEFDIVKTDRNGERYVVTNWGDRVTVREHL